MYLIKLSINFTHELYWLCLLKGDVLGEGVGDWAEVVDEVVAEVVTEVVVVVGVG